MNNPQENTEGQQNTAQGISFFQKIVSIIMQMVIIHLVMNFITGGKNKIQQKGLIPERNTIILKNSFEQGELFDVYIYLSNHQSLDLDYVKKNSFLIKVREQESYVYKRFTPYEKIEYTFLLNDSWKKEKYLTVAVIPMYFYKKRVNPLQDSVIKEEYKDQILIDNIPLLTNMVPFDVEDEEKYNLISGSPTKTAKMKKEQEEQEQRQTQTQTQEINEKTKGKKELLHIKKRIDINIIYELAKHRLTDFNMPHMKTWRINLETQTFTPPVYLSDFWLLENDYFIYDEEYMKKEEEKKQEKQEKQIKPLKNYVCLNVPFLIKDRNKNDFIIEKEEPNGMNKETITITINFGICSFIYYALTKQLNESFTNLEEPKNFSLQSFTSTTTVKEIHMMKKIFLTTNIYMLIFSAVFILLHSIFSFFAFKNDMQFWYQNESMEGLSALSVITAFVCDLILALYLYDSENTSWLLLFEMFIGVALSAWKVTKAVNVSFKKQYPFLIIKDKKNYTESMTKKYDKIAVKYVGIVLFPCFIGYAIYALFNYKYRSWYSYIISVLAGTVYTFGFVMMTPQLYINYKLKSVEHLPWRALIYKSLNTFIDDIAFFLIDMPWMHKLSCFRDDVIFLCYIYQRCIYKVDKNRTQKLNETIDNKSTIENTQAEKAITQQPLTNQPNKKND